MAKLSKIEARNHIKAVELLEKDLLTDDEKEFIFENWHEGATHINGVAGAFFTPLSLAWDAALEVGGESEKPWHVVDLCAGIGILAYAILRRYPDAKVVCVEINPEYVEIGKRLVPEAEWYCMDVTDVCRLKALGGFHCAISNPPFGRVASFKGKGSPAYRGGEAEYKVIDVAGVIANYGIFIVPQQSSGFRYSGVQCYERNESDKYKKFCADTGLRLDVGMGIDTSCEGYGGWKGVKPSVELVCVDFHEREIEEDVEQFELFANA